MINAKLQEFVGSVIAKGQIGYGDVRRLQRDYLPGGITNHEELELLLSLNAGLVRADRAWAQWLVASVAEFVAKEEAGEHPSNESVGKLVGRLLAASTTSCGRRVARQVRRELGRRHGVQATNAAEPHREGVPRYSTQRLSRAGAQEKDSPRMAKRACRHRGGSQPRPRPSRRTVRRETIPGTVTFASAAQGWCPIGYLPALHHSHFMNFQSARVSLVLAPCR